MSTKLQWLVPCYFDVDENADADEEIILDITNDVKHILTLEISEKKIEYGHNYGLKTFVSDEVEKVLIKILPKFRTGLVNSDRIQEYIMENLGKIYLYFNVDEDYKKWHYTSGIVIIETHLTRKTKIPSRDQIKTMNSIPHGFLQSYHQYNALQKEISFLFLSALHLTYPTTSFMGLNSTFNGGIIHFFSGKRHFYENLKTDVFMHHVLITQSRVENLKSNLSGIAKVWNCNLWSLKRYLIAVESHVDDMDKLLDLVYALEGLFEKNTSSDFIKLFCIIHLSKNKNEARKLKAILDSVFKIRNEIAHGGFHYRGYEHIKVNGKEILSQDLYWEMKVIVSTLIIMGINRILQNKDIRNLNFKIDDLYDRIYTS
ncbi:hypothetical protein H9Q08_03205 [Chryseobacterium sp. PS-8]|uniref:Apea-like HEPN domain-containing protein n=1 Tax=Chryseobacterium indicum TaxID=2766954 RepID=A0ABS9C3I1_9FLAO|nr:HEPN domain-containing protein [Chryseobacterium sp. PS-8]MCF2218307.1 hypothetical protein [Chryseobacterium sp. PS-8]